MRTSTTRAFGYIDCGKPLRNAIVCGKTAARKRPETCSGRKSGLVGLLCGYLFHKHCPSISRDACKGQNFLRFDGAFFAKLGNVGALRVGGAKIVPVLHMSAGAECRVVAH